jgi:hypothetical protein
MTIRSLATLSLVTALAAAPVMAGTLGGTVSDPEVRAPVILPPGGLGTGAIAAGVVGAAVVIALVAGSDDDTTTTTTTSPATN